jgi:hypothetical protein
MTFLFWGVTGLAELAEHSGRSAFSDNMHASISMSSEFHH